MKCTDHKASVLRILPEWDSGNVDIEDCPQAQLIVHTMPTSHCEQIGPCDSEVTLSAITEIIWYYGKCKAKLEPGFLTQPGAESLFNVRKEYTYLQL